MPLKNKFRTIKILHENDSTIIRRAVRLSDNKSIIIKQLKQSSRQEYKINQFLNEEEILSKLKANGVIKLLDVISEPDIYCHILEDIGGNSLYDISLKYKFSLNEALNIALISAKTFEYLHKHNIIHADINPKNMVYNTSTKALQIIDFGISIKNKDFTLNKKEKPNSSGNLFYISPEQTGLTEYKISYRSDIYSLGMSLYYVFLGKAPLQAKNPYELVHKQIALMPTQLCEADAKIPKVISDIINKMINKKPEKRYQSIQAVIYDLTKCIQKLDKFNNINYFKIASLDKPNLHIGDNLVGRDKEMNTLKETLKNADKAPFRIIISGITGSGKTKLVNEFLNSIDTDKTNVLTGKFDKYKGYLPYAGYKQIFANLNSIITIQEMQMYIKHMYPNTPKILNMFFPELNHLFQMQTTGHDIADFLYTKDQLSFAVKDLFKAITRSKKPLIIFFDDIQWIDQSSSQLLKTSVLNSENPYIHFISTMRNDSNEQNVNLLDTITTLKQNKQFKNVEIKINNLLKKDINKMLQILLQQSNTSLNKLTTIIYEKTDGNPFYIKTFIEYLLDNKSLYFNNGKWNYSLSKIATYNKQTDITELVKLKLNRLNKEEKLCLQYLSVMGNKFNFYLALKIMQSHSLKEKTINTIIKNDLITIRYGMCQFSHDTIQQDIFTSLDEETKYKIHKHIGLYLEKEYKTDKYHDIIIVAYHLNRAYPPQKTPKRLFKLNIISITEMLNNNSYKLALSKINWIDTTFFNDKMWEQNHTDAFNYSILKAKTLYLNTQLTQANKQLLLSLEKSKSIKERLLCFTLLKDISITKGNGFKELVEFGNQLFKELEIDVPKTKKELSLKVRQISKDISNHHLFINPNELLKHSNLKNTKLQRISSLLVEYWEAAYYVSNIDLMKWCYLNIIYISFKYGNSSESTFGYVLYGSYLVSQKEYKKAQLFGDIALKLNIVFDDTKMLPKIHNFVANFINPYTKRLTTNIKLYEKSLIQSKMDGNIVFGTWANFLMHFSNYLSGESLEKVEFSLKSENRFILSSGDEKMIAIFDVLKNSIKSLQTQNTNSSDKKIITMWEKENFHPALAWYAIIKAQYCFIDNKIHKGLAFLNKYVHSESNDIIMFPKINLHFIRAMLLLQADKELNKTQKKILTSDLDEIHGYYITAPSTFRFYKLLLDAESKKDIESTWDVAKRYDRAIKQAKKEKNTFFIAIANLSASRFWEKLEYTDMKNLYLNKAISGFNKWGAYSIATKLKVFVAKMVVTTPPNLNNTSSMDSSSRIRESSFKTLIKSYNTLSSSTSSKKLIDTFMTIILQNATASSGILILRENGEFLVKASIDYSKNGLEYIDENLKTYKFIPKSIIKSVITTGKKIILNHPYENGRFQFDPYFKENKPASSIAIPMKTDGFVEGVLYLQNNEIFVNLDDETIKILELLLTQIAIILNNIKLYKHLKTNDIELNKAQELLHVGSWQFNFSNNEIAWSAETYRIFDIEPFSMVPNYNVFLSFLHPDDKKDFIQAQHKAIKETSMCNIEHRIITAKGNIKFVKQKAEVYVTNGIKKMSGSIQDITSTKRDQEQIALLSEVIAQSPNSIVITDIAGNIQYTNKQFEYNTGYTNDEVVGLNMNILNSQKNPISFYEKLWNTILINRQIWRGMIVDKIKNKKLLDFETIIFPIFDSKDEIVNFVAIQEDITEKNLHDKLFLMQTRQAQMGEMISMIAHQWRQPLGAISATAIGLQMRMKLQPYDLKTKEGQEEQSTYFLEQLQKIEHFVLGLSTTIDDFRNFYKPDKRPVMGNLKSVVLKSLNIIRSSLKNHNITLIEKYNTSREVEFYDSELIQVILNILKNAQDAFEEKHIQSATITITTEENTIRICDNAGGIPEDIIDNIFEVYFSTKNEKNGTGLGLYMSKIIIERHHDGILNVKNIDGGVCFLIKIGSIPPPS